MRPIKPLDNRLSREENLVIGLALVFIIILAYSSYKILKVVEPSQPSANTHIQKNMNSNQATRAGVINH